MSQRNIRYVVYRDGDYFVSQCLNVEVSSFGDTREEAVENLREALELYFEEDGAANLFRPVEDALCGDISINV
ncbi:MAG: type II toxin-antitoxin system HicB family antitoxin [Deltaproteobacteria bacterium]|nr:type II toxin-antitoxin system HicB family antitoxin [Deltaproteobacteria bacterium]